MTQIVDLRSDTVTRPSRGMLDAMTRAPLGDDVLGDDPTVISLQERFAAYVGKPAACFVPSGTMANQLSIRAQTEPGDEVIAHEDSHIIHYETGAPAALSGCMIRVLRGARGQYTAADVEQVIRPENIHSARSKLVVIENTHNRGGGSIWPLAEVERVTATAREHGLRAHLDGARLWNACVATGLKPTQYTRHFNTVSCCFSKGLGAPVGSAVAGDAETIKRVHRFRKMFGGAMRQAGLLAAACLYAMEHNIERLAEDQANARRLAEGIGNMPGLSIAPDQRERGVETNIVYFDLAPSAPMSAAEFCEKLKAEGVWMLPTAPRRVRAVTHLDVSREMIDRALLAIESALTLRVA